MKKSILFLLTSFVLLLADFAASAQAPTISSPANGATVNPFDLTVTGTTGRVGVRRVRAIFTDGNGDLINVIPRIPNYGTGLPASTIYSINLSDQIDITNIVNPYTIRIETSTATSGAFTAFLEITVNVAVPVASDPIVVSPADGSTVDLCNDVVFTVNANYSGARRLQYAIAPNGLPNSPIEGPTDVFLLDATEATTDFDLPPIDRTLFANNAQYLLELKTFDLNDNQIGNTIYHTILTGSDVSGTAANTPVITSPTNGSTVNSFTPVITIASPFAGCQFNTVLYEILQGTSGNTVVSFQSYTTPTYNWTVPTFLTADSTYRVRVTYNVTINGVATNFPSIINTFTISSAPGVTISSPVAPRTGLNPCGFPVTVAAYPNATTVRVEYKRTADASYTTFYSTPVIASTTMSFSFNNTQLRANQSYDLRLTAGTGTGGTFAAISSQTNFTFSTGGVGGTLTPTLASPANGATGVSLTPTITFGTYQGSCGAVGLYQIEIVPIGGTGDWNTRAGYYYATSATSSFVIPNGTLLQNTTYKVRVSVQVDLNGGVVGYYGNYDGTDSSPNIYTFTTISPTLPSTLITNIADDTYLNKFSQSFVANAVTGATSYEWQFSTNASFTGGLITKTSTTSTLNFQANEAGFVPGQQYFVRVRGVSASAQGVFSTDPAQVTSYYHPLFGSAVTSPTTSNLTERIFTLKGLAIANANAYCFQMAIANSANDGNPAADFTVGNIFVNPAGYYGTFSYPGLYNNSTVEQITSLTGPFFYANTIKTFAWGTEFVVNYIKAQPQTRYRVRVVPVKYVGNQIVQQMELSNVPVATFDTYGIPNRSHYIISPTNNQTNVNNTESINLTRITIKGLALQWDITNYQIQVSTSPTFASGVITLPDDATFTGTGTVGGVTEGDPVIFVPNLAFNTTYYVRARSTAVVNGSPSISAWGPVTQFVTKATAAGRVGAQGAAMDDVSVSYPNPFDRTINIRVSATHSTAVVRVRDLTGRLIETRQENGGNTLQLGESYSKGMYIVTIESADKIETLKVIKR